MAATTRTTDPRDSGVVDDAGSAALGLIRAVTADTRIHSPSCSTGADAGLGAGSSRAREDERHERAAAIALLGLSGCADMSTRDKNIVGGAAIGGAAGAVLTGGSPLGTVGGAAVGGVVGNEISKDRR